MPILSGILILFFIVTTCKRFEPELFLEITTDSIEALPGREYKLTGSLVSFGYDEITQHGFCWGESHDPAVNGPATQLGPRNEKGSFTSVISGLSASTTFYVRSYVVTSAGTEYGEEKSFTTPSPALPVVTTTAVTNISQDSAQSGGNITDDGGASIVTRGVCWDTTAYPTIINSHTKDGSGTGIFTSSITGLDCNTTYYVRAYATNSVDTAYGNQVIFTTSQCPDVNLPTVVTSYLSNTTASSSVGGGEVTDDGGGTITARGVCWSTSQNPTILDFTTDNETGIGSFTSSITELTKSTTYYVRAYATNSAGTNYGEEVILRTYEGTVTDYDGNEYWTVIIGDQKWMAENLKATRYADGSAIPLVTDAAEWDALTETGKAYCWYDNSTANRDIYGGLYNWAAVVKGAAGSDENPSGIQGVCPDGWHIPSDAELKELEMFLGMSQADADDVDHWRGTDEGGKLKETGTTHWTSPNTGATNESGFTALPGGYRNNDGPFYVVGDNTVFWTATGSDGQDGYSRSLGYNIMNIYRYYGSKNDGFSVRCVEGQGYSVPTVTTTAATNITVNSAESGGNVTDDGGQPVTEKGVCWSTDPNPTIDGDKTSNGSGSGNFTSLLTGLDPSTNYFFRAYATNSVGTGYGEQDTITTDWNSSVTVTDYDGNVYQTVQIGEQLWMAENLKVTRYADGSNLTDGTGAGVITGDQSTPYYFAHNDNSSRVETYGRLYTWAAIMDEAGGSDALPSGVQGVCPDGWHVPSDAEWQLLETTLDMSASDAANWNWRGTDQGTQLKSGGSSGFEGLLGGYRDHNGNSYDLGNYGYFWSTTDDGSNATIRQLGATSSQVRRTGTDKSNACSVRCLGN